MKIERNSKISVRFKDIKRGDVFIDDEGDVCMKTEHLSSIKDAPDVNAVLLESGVLFFIEDDDFVWLPTSIKFTIEE